ncbi:MAG: DUF378 domain-containing protein [Candidatus Nanosalina sp.]
MTEYEQLDGLSLLLVIVGALNWGLVGAADFNLVSTLFGSGSVIARAVYVLVGLAGLYTAYYSYEEFVA